MVGLSATISSAVTSGLATGVALLGDFTAIFGVLVGIAVFAGALMAVRRFLG